MISRVQLGSYVPRNSPIHNLDPRAKILFLLLFTSLLFIRISFIQQLHILLIIFLIYRLSRLSIQLVFTSIKLAIFISIFVFFINSFFPAKISSTFYSFKWKIFAFEIGDNLVQIRIYYLVLSSINFIRSLYLILRIFQVFLLNFVFVSTTKLWDINLGLKRSLSFAEKMFGVPINVFSLILSLAATSVFSILIDAKNIVNSQASRGLDLNHEKKIKRKIRAIIALIVPLINTTFRRSELMAWSLLARGYSPRSKRTEYKTLNFNLIDYLTCFFFVAVFVFHLFVYFKIGQIVWLDGLV